MKLIKSQVVFNPDEHTYMLGDKELSGITSVISRQLFPDKYRDVPEYVLRKAAERGTMIHKIWCTSCPMFKIIWCRSNLHIGWYRKYLCEKII